jgi:hypothetical protein
MMRISAVWWHLSSAPLSPSREPVRENRTVSSATSGENRWPSPEQVIAALDASGHLLEQQVATELEDLGFNVITNRAYTDVDEGKSRELDVWAHKYFFTLEERRLWAGIQLLIECKHTAMPFAFLTRPPRRRNRPPEEAVITHHSRKEEHQDGDRKLVRTISTFDDLGLDDLYWGTNSPHVAVHISHLDRKGGTWNANNTGVFDSLTWPLAKALRAFKKPFRNKNGGFDPRTDASFVMFFIPMVVVASKLYAVDGTIAAPAAVEVDHIRFERELKAKDFEGSFAIDFVQHDRLAHFITETVDPFGEHVAEIVRSDPDRFIPAEKWPMWTDW